MTGEMVPFGKYKGQPVEALAADREYCEWLLSQPWFASRYGNVYNILISYGGEPQDSPEHNEMQARFLEDNWCLQLAAVLEPSLAHSYGKDGALAQMKVSPLLTEFARCCKPEIAQAAVTKRGFEVSGWDVTFKVKPVAITARVVTLAPLAPCTCKCDHAGCLEGATCRGGTDRWSCHHHDHPEKRGTKASDHCTEGCPWGSKGAMQQSVEDQPDAYRWRSYRAGDGYSTTKKADWLHYGMKHGHVFSVDEPGQFLVELKPDLGDDYPAVLRQVSGYRYGGDSGTIRCVVARRHAFQAVTWGQVKKIFAASGITLVTESEIEVAADPEKRVLALLERELGGEVISERD